MFAEVSLPISSFQIFTYSIPENLKNSLLVGSRVKVPFGARKVSGIVVSLIDESSFAGNLKSIIDVDDNTPVLSNELWKLVNWISHYYVTPIGLAYNTVLPFSLLSSHSPRLSWFVRYVARHKANKKNTYEKLIEEEKILTAKLKDLDHKISLINKNDPDYLDMLFRQKFNYVTEDEIIIKLK